MSIRKLPAGFGGFALLALLGCDEPEREVDEITMVTEQPTTRGPAATDEATEIDVTLHEWRVMLGQTEIPAGEVVIRVRNQGSIHHALEVERGAVEWETTPIAPSGEATLRMVLEPGEYEVYCPIDDHTGDHEELGMTTVLRVR